MPMSLGQPKAGDLDDTRMLELARAAEIPGTPVLIAGGVLVMGYGPDAWLKALGEAGVCK